MNCAFCDNVGESLRVRKTQKHPIAGVSYRSRGRDLCRDGQNLSTIAAILWSVALQWHSVAATPKLLQLILCAGAMTTIRVIAASAETAWAAGAEQGDPAGAILTSTRPGGRGRRCPAPASLGRSGPWPGGSPRTRGPSRILEEALKLDKALACVAATKHLPISHTQTGKQLAGTTTAIAW